MKRLKAICRPVYGSCNLPSGHKGMHNAHAKKRPDLVVFSACCNVPAIFESAAEGYVCPKCGSSDQDE